MVLIKIKNQIKQTKMKQLMIAVMLLISTVGMSQVTVYEYIGSGKLVGTNKYNVTNNYDLYSTSIRMEIINRAPGTDKTARVMTYDILSRDQGETDGNKWTEYNCKTNGYYITLTFFHDRSIGVLQSYDSGKYTITKGTGLKY
jgi:hypothetical protein